MSPVAILFVGVGLVLGGILLLRLHAFLALLLAAFAVAVLTPRERLGDFAAAKVASGAWSPAMGGDFAASTAADRVAKGFGATAESIGILIALAAIIGKCLLDSGAADRIVRAALRLVGQGRAALAFLGSGFVLGIPVFFDTVFYLMMPLGKALWLRTRRDYVLYVLAIVAGGTMAHSLVPPTPGPLFVADALGVGLLTMIVAGSIVGSVAAASGYLFARWINRRMEIPLRDSADARIADLEALAGRPDRDLPPLGLALLPIALPVLLIALDAGLRAYLDGLPSGENPPPWATLAAPIAATVGDKNVALGIAAAIAMGLLVRRARGGLEGLKEAVAPALASGGVIILITSAGGAFGAAVQQGGVAGQIADLARGISPMLILPMAWLVTALIRTAQGSATVAMITAVGVLEQLAAPSVLGCHPVYLALAIGCGSKPVAWMADSGFWVICKMSGLTESEGLQTVSPLTVVMGVVGLLATMLGAALWPMV